MDNDSLLEYYKIKFSSRSFTNIFHKFVVRSTYEAGFIDAYTEDGEASYFQRFSLGGNGMQTSTFASSDIIALRGYDNNSLTPPNGGKAYSKYNVELRYPILMESAASVIGLMFVEGAQAWSELEEFTPFESYQSAGYGVRIMVPAVGIIGLDMAYGYDRIVNPGDSKWQFHFSLGQDL